MKQVIAIVSALCVILIGLGYYFTTRTEPIGPRITPISDQYNTRVADGVWRRGNLNSKVVFTEYADFQCPGCAAMFPIVSEVYAKKKDTVKFEYYHYPLAYHNKSTLAAIASEAAGRQGKFWEMYELLFSRNAAWADKTPYAFRDDLSQYAKDLGINVDQFKRDLDDKSIEDQINNDKKKGDAIPLESTPTIMINGKVVKEIPKTADAIIQLLDDAEKNM